jgi:hypothetical protein
MEVREIHCGTNKSKLTTIPNDKSDIIIRNNEKQTHPLIDTKTAGGRIVIKKEAKKKECKI